MTTKTVKEWREVAQRFITAAESYEVHKGSLSDQLIFEYADYYRRKAVDVNAAIEGLPDHQQITL